MNIGVIGPVGPDHFAATILVTLLIRAHRPLCISGPSTAVHIRQCPPSHVRIHPLLSGRGIKIQRNGLSVARD